MRKVEDSFAARRVGESSAAVFQHLEVGDTTVVVYRCLEVEDRRVAAREVEGSAGFGLGSHCPVVLGLLA